MGRFTSFAVANVLALTATARPSNFRRQDGNSSMIYDYADLSVSPEIQWTPCFDKFTCMNLEVPLDYADESVGTTNIAFIKLSGGNGTATQDILFNPGGPGAGGVASFLGGLGEEILTNFGNNANYNLVSFDPRGVNNSGPNPLTCFATPEQKEGYVSLKPPLSAPLPEHWQSSKALGEWCTEVNLETNTKYVGTSANVQDMMHYTELTGALNGVAAEDVRIWYYGVSYGTIMGQTLAAMYPDRLGRVILDGNVYGVEHYKGVTPSDVDDTDQTLGFFFQYCFEAGPSRCAFAGNSSSAGEIELRYRKVLQGLEDLPLAVGKVGDAPAPGILNSLDVRNTIFGKLLYGPMSGFPVLSKIMAELEHGNATTYIKLAFPSAEGASISPHDEETNEETMIITCVDVNTHYNLSSLEEYEALVDSLKRESYYNGETTAKTNILMCNGVEIIPPESQIFDASVFEDSISTSVPVLFVGNTGDPITPLSSALRMSAVFEGSTVLTHDAPGHGFMAVKSSCTEGHVQAYLADLTLPDPGTVCETDIKPFIDDPAARRMVKRNVYRY